MENTHGATLAHWAAAIQAPLGIALGAPWSPMGVRPLLPDGVTPVPPKQVTAHVQTATPQVVFWSLHDLPPGLWPSSQAAAPGGQFVFQTGPVVWEPLVEIIRFLLNYP
jgi:hypothetical protein